MGIFDYTCIFSGTLLLYTLNSMLLDIALILKLKSDNFSSRLGSDSENNMFLDFAFSIRFNEHIGSPQASASALHKTMSFFFARVRLTLSLRLSLKKPTEVLLVRTQLKIITSASEPWNESTVETNTSSAGTFLVSNKFVIKLT